LTLETLSLFSFLFPNSLKFKSSNPAVLPSILFPISSFLFFHAFPLIFSPYFFEPWSPPALPKAGKLSAFSFELISPVIPDLFQKGREIFKLRCYADFSALRADQSFKEQEIQYYVPKENNRLLRRPGYNFRIERVR